VAPGGGYCKVCVDDTGERLSTVDNSWEDARTRKKRRCQLGTNSKVGGSHLQYLLFEVYLHSAHLVIELKRHYGYPWLQMEIFITGKVSDILFLVIFFFLTLYSHSIDIDRCYEATCVDGVMSAEPSLVDPTNIFGEYARQRRNRRRLEILASETTEGAPEKEPPVITTTPNPTTNPNGTSTITHTQLPIALSYLNCVARYPEESTPKRVREHLFHLLGYRQRSFHQFKSKGDNYLKQFLWLNKQVLPCLFAPFLLIKTVTLTFSRYCRSI